MKLIVEAGSTKTDSVLIDKQNKVKQRHSSPGINPVSDKYYQKAIDHLMQPFLTTPLESVHYYGSGCVTPEVCKDVTDAIQSSTAKKATIEVNDDLIAVGRGICQYESGIVGILGTGSNIGYYDGRVISYGIKSCGYLLGDEGSGFRLGQVIYRNLARNNYPDSVAARIKRDFDLIDKELITHLYKQPNQRSYLASFARAFQYLEEKDKEALIDEVFDPLIDRLLFPMYQRYQSPIHLIGSIAVYFEEPLKNKLGKFNIIAAGFNRSPLEGLVRFHRYE